MAVKWRRNNHDVLLIITIFIWISPVFSVCMFNTHHRVRWPAHMNAHLEATHTVSGAAKCKVLCQQSRTCEGISVGYSYDRGVLCQIITDIPAGFEQTLEADENFVFYSSKAFSLISRITSCSISSPSYAPLKCRDVYEGIELATVVGSGWAASFGLGVGEWLQVDLDDWYVLTSIGVVDRCHRLEQTSSWDVSLGSGADVKLYKPCGGSNSWNDCTGVGNGWYFVDMKPTPSVSVKFTIATVCDVNGYHGFREINLHGFNE